ncbi:MAG: hypothetical protein KDK62_04900 [Chlamydiia bacterium]|nr:hypothetical protein [Chlamydiia bacterium]
MKPHKVSVVLLSLLCFLPLVIYGEEGLNRKEFTLGGTVSYLKREKSGGSNQTGTLGGIRAGFDRFKRYSWYIGAETEALWGTLRGHNRFQDKLHSDFISFWGEGRFGYTFQSKCFPYLAFTPFIGGGFLEENNNFSSPSPIPIHFRTHAPYAAGGFFSWIDLGSGFEGGLNLKLKLPIDPKCHVHNDPMNPPSQQLINERLLWRIELPLSYRLNPCASRLVTISPFWELRSYGKRINYPFDFLNTRLNFWGVSVLYVIRI